LLGPIKPFAASFQNSAQFITNIFSLFARSRQTFSVASFQSSAQFIADFLKWKLVHKLLTGYEKSITFLEYFFVWNK
jgi:hypothetical protein